MVIVNVSQDHVGIPTNAYFAVEEIKDVRFHSISHTKKFIAIVAK
jgi:hypothetical protein